MVSNEKIVTYILWAGVAYFVYSYLSSSGLLPSISSAVTAATLPAGTVVVSDATLAQVVSLAQTNPNYAKQGGSLTGYEWDYYFNKLTGASPYVGTNSTPYGSANYMTAQEWQRQANGAENAPSLVGLG